MTAFMRVFVIGAVAAAGLAPGLAAAQDVAVGVRGGVVWSTLATGGFDDELEPDAGTGGTIGGFVEAGSARMVSFRPEVLVTWRRFTLSDGETDRDSGATAIDVPLLLCLRTASAARAKGVLFVGPQLSFLTSVWQEVGGVRADIDEAIKDVDAGLTFGGGVEAPAGRGAFLLDARLTIGLKNLWEQEGPTVKSRGFGVMIGYRF